ncbi:MAG: hypothetical protein KF740_17870 [Ramlibacter sp.]|nr:hypothetical protein [Ramlibacter sp.]
MHADPIQALRAAQRVVPAAAPRDVLLVAGATGTLGGEVLRRLAGSQRFAVAHVLAREPFTDGLRGVRTLCVPGDEPASWPRVAASSGVIMFDPPRLFHDRERALWTPAPADLVAVARWMRDCGARTLAVVLPHAQGRLPAALRHGLAGLDEQAVASLGFERVLFVRSAQRPGAAVPGRPLLQRVAHWMLSVFQYMVPSSEQPVRAVKVAEFVDLALQLAPPGIHVAAPDLVWRAAQQDLRQAVARWLQA